MNLSDFVINVSAVPGDKSGITMVDVAAFCGASDAQAKIVSIVGFILGMLLIVYFGRIREQLVKYPRIVQFLDKFLLVSNVLSFGIIITRLYYAS